MNNALILLMGLLVLSYFGSLVVGGRRLRGFGLASGTEWVVLGLLLGPRVLGLIDHTVVGSFEPIALVAMSWLALIVGLEFGYARVDNVERPIPVRRIFLSSSLALFTGVMIAGALEALLRLGFPEIPFRERLLISGGIAAASSETTRHAIRWVVERHHAKGPLSDLLGDIADADEILPLISLPLLFSLDENAPVNAIQLSAIGYVVVSVGLGALLGAIAAALIGRAGAGTHFHTEEAWGVMIGASLLAFGLADRLGLPSLTVAFFLGLTLARASRHRDQLVAMILPTESSVMLPALLLVGARIDWADPWRLAAIALVAATTRAISKMMIGLLLRPLLPALKNARLRIGLGLVPTGALSLGIGLLFALRFPGVVGKAVLAASAALAVVGEMLGPAVLEGELRKAGEIAPNGSASAPPAAAEAKESAA